MSQDAALIACVCVIRSMKSVGSRCVHATAVQGCTGEVFWDKTVEASRQQPGCLGSASRLKSRPWPWPRIPPSRRHRGRTSLLIGEQEKSIHSWSKPKAFGWKPHLASIQEETLPREKKDANCNLKLQNEVAENKLDGAWSLHSFLLSSPHTITDGTIPMCARNTLELRWPTNWHGQVLEKLWHSKFWERFQFSSPSSVCIDSACIGQSVGIWVSILILRRSVDNRELRQVGENNFRVKKFLIGGIWTTRPSTVLGFRWTIEGQNLQPRISKYWNVAKFGANLLWSQFLSRSLF